MIDDPIRETLTGLSRYLVGDTTLAEALDRVCEVAIQAIDAAAWCGMSMLVEGRVDTFVASHPQLEEIDRAQYDSGEGPCLDAFRTGQQVIVPSLREPGPYPEFRAAAVAHGVRAVLASPLVAGGETVGALNLYADVEDTFTDAERDLAQALATQGAFLLVNTKAYWDARTLNDHLGEALQSGRRSSRPRGSSWARRASRPTRPSVAWWSSRSTST